MYNMSVALVFAFLAAFTTFTCCETVYPLYTINSINTGFTDSDYNVIANNFGFAQMTASSEQINGFHKVNPNFKVVQYFDSLTGPANTIEPINVRKSVAFTPNARLSFDISTTDTTLDFEYLSNTAKFLASTIPGDISKNGAEYVTFIRVGDEIMRVDKVLDNKLVVTRGLDDTRPTKHNENSTIFSPLYYGERVPGFSKDAHIVYQRDPEAIAYPQALVNATSSSISKGYDGSWFDNFAAGMYDTVRIDNKKVKLDEIWNFKTGSPYTTDVHVLAEQNALKSIWNQLYQKFGHYPTILANNAEGCWFPEKGNCRILVEGSTVRPLDGYSLESFSGSEQNTDPFHNGCNISSLSWSFHPLTIWVRNVQNAMDAAQKDLQAFPMISQAGCKSPFLEIAKDRDRIETFGYSSFLLASSHPKQKMRFGLPCMYRNASGHRYAHVHERYSWNIGTPIHTETPDNISGYQPEGHVSYMRLFDNGAILVNPTNNTDTPIKLPSELYDPVEKQYVQKVTMLAHTGLILLKSPP